jgi:PST family polysaccharide transporter
MIIGLVRTKLVAVLIGPAGVGYVGVYHSLTSLASTVAGLGIQTSGVRDIAKHHAAENEVEVAKTVRTLRRISWLTGFAGMMILALLAPWLSRISFGTTDHAWAIASLGLIILLGNISGGQGAIIQGTRRIADLAKISIWGAIWGTVVSVCFYYFLGVRGIVPALLSLSGITLVISTYYASRIPVASFIPSWQETWQRSRSLVSFGIAMVVNGVLATGVAYLTRLLIAKELGIAAVGIYTAAYSLSAMFVQFVLGAMAADFYPRLTAEAHDPRRMVQLINEQTEIGLLLAFPGLVATLAFAPLVISIFYTSEFAEASDLLRWFVIGCMGRVISWPLGFSLLAKGQGRLFMLTETSFNFLHLLMVGLCLRYFGIVGAAIAFAGLYFTYSIGMLLVNRYTIDFRWSTAVARLIAWMIPTALLVFATSYWLKPFYALTVAVPVMIIVGILSARQLVRRVGPDNNLSKLLKLAPVVSRVIRG